MITGVAHVAFNVLNLDKMLEFYIEGLGMKVAFEMTSKAGFKIIYVKMAPMVFIEFFDRGVKDRDLNYGPTQIGVHHWCISCTNINAMRERLLAKGFVTEDMKPAPLEGVYQNWWVHDPDGNALEINQIESDDVYQGRDEILGIHHIGSVIKDIEKTREFYRDLLGFKEFRTMEKDGKPWITFMEISPNTTSEVSRGQTWEFFWGGTDIRPNTWQSYGITHICLECDDVEAMVKYLRSKGWIILLEPKIGTDMNLQAWVVDPDGIRIELMQLSPDSPQAKA